jgi:hypothetical protein
MADRGGANYTASAVLRRRSYVAGRVQLPLISARPAGWQRADRPPHALAFDLIQCNQGPVRPWRHLWDGLTVNLGLIAEHLGRRNAENFAHPPQAAWTQSRNRYSIVPGSPAIEGLAQCVLFLPAIKPAERHPGGGRPDDHENNPPPITADERWVFHPGGWYDCSRS